MNFDSTKFIASIANSLSNSQEECIDLMSRTLNTVMDDNVILRGAVDDQCETIEKLRKENEALKMKLVLYKKELTDTKAALEDYQTKCHECDGRDECDCETLGRLQKAEDKLARIGVLFKRFSDEVKDGDTD